jgi:hypothetical protein
MGLEGLPIGGRGVGGQGLFHPGEFEFFNKDEEYDYIEIYIDEWNYERRLYDEGTDTGGKLI